MLKIFVLGCLLSLALAQPMNMGHKRLARSDSDSGSNSGSYERRPSNQPTPQQWLQFLYNFYKLQQTTTTSPTTTTTAATTTTTTTTAATTTAAVTTAAPATTAA